MQLTTTGMAFIVFTFHNPKGVYQDGFYRDSSIEKCLDVLNFLVMAKRKLVGVRLAIEGSDHLTWLPIEAFDGELLSGPLKELQQEWEAVLQLP